MNGDSSQLRYDIEDIMHQLEVHARTYRLWSHQLAMMDGRMADSDRAMGHSDGLMDAHARLRSVVRGR